MNNEDPRITAYALGELSGTELETFEKELAASPETEQAVREVRATADFLREGFGAEAERGGLTGAQKEAVLAGRGEQSDGDGTIIEVSFWRRTRRHVIWAGSAAAAVLCVLFVVRQEETIEADSRSAPAYESYRQAAEGRQTGKDDQVAGFRDVGAVSGVDANEVEMTVTVRSDDSVAASPSGKQEQQKEKELREVQEMPALRRAVEIGDVAAAQDEARMNETGRARSPEVAAALQPKMEVDELSSQNVSGTAIVGGDEVPDSKLPMKTVATATAPAPVPVIKGPAGVSDEAMAAASSPSLRRGDFDADKGAQMAPLAAKAATEAGDTLSDRSLALAKKTPVDADGIREKNSAAVVAATVPAWKDHTRIDAKNGPVTDSSKKVMVFEDTVRVDHAAFELSCDRLEVFLYDDGKIGQSASDGNASDLEAATKGERRSDIMKAIARGAVVITTKGRSGVNPVGKCREAIYEDATGDLVLRGLPEVQRGVDVVIATDEKTTIRFKADGDMEVRGPHRTKTRKGSPPGPVGR